MNSVSKDIVQMLNDESSVNLTENVDLFYSRTPIKPQNCVTVYDNSGPSPMLQYVKARSNYYYHSIEIRVRNTNYNDGWVVIQEVLLYLHGLSQIVIGDTYYALINAINPPHQLHYDENDRPVLNINFEVQRRFN